MHDILVTGAEGFLGKEVVLLLKKKKYSFVGVTRNKQSNSHISCDLSKPSNVLSLLKNKKPKTIINLAATVNFQTDNPESLFPVNTLLPALFANYCFENKAHFIQSSTINVHGFMHKSYNSHTELSPDTVYGHSKLLADNNILSAGCDASILRFGGIFGKNGPPHLGVNQAIGKALNGTPPSIVGSGKAKRNYIFVKDAAEVIVECIENILIGIHYLGGEIKTIEQMLKDICEILVPGNSPIYVDGNEAKDQIIKNDLDFKITPFREAIARFA